MLLSVVAIFETFRSNRPKFAIGFWGMVFPLVSAGGLFVLFCLLSDRRILGRLCISDGSTRPSF